MPHEERDFHSQSEREHYQRVTIGTFSGALSGSFWTVKENLTLNLFTYIHRNVGDSNRTTQKVRPSKSWTIGSLQRGAFVSLGIFARYDLQQQGKQQSKQE
jgi:hypothetical protein